MFKNTNDYSHGIAIPDFETHLWLKFLNILLLFCLGIQHWSFDALRLHVLPLSGITISHVPVYVLPQNSSIIHQLHYNVTGGWLTWKIHWLVYWDAGLLVK
jgi:hypothetical protein